MRKVRLGGCSIFGSKLMRADIQPLTHLPFAIKSTVSSFDTDYDGESARLHLGFMHCAYQASYGMTSLLLSLTPKSPPSSRRSEHSGLSRTVVSSSRNSLISAMKRYVGEMAALHHALNSILPTLVR